MAHRELRVTVLSAQDLKNVRLSGRKMSPYAEVGIRSSAATKVQTGVHSGGGINPSWNYVVTLPCEEELFRSGGAVTIALRHRGSFCDKHIGTATVPLSDLSLQCRAADSNASRESTPMSYQVRERSGKPHGVLNISVLVGSLVKRAAYGKPSVAWPSETAPPVTTYPAYSQGAYAPPNVAQIYSQTNPQRQQLYPPQHNAYPASQQDLYPPQHNAYPASQQDLYPPQYQPQYAQRAGYSYQQAAY